MSTTTWNFGKYRGHPINSRQPGHLDYLNWVYNSWHTHEYLAGNKAQRFCEDYHQEMRVILLEAILAGLTYGQEHEFELKPSQIAAIEFLDANLLGSSNNVAKLNGPAGHGKTTVLKTLLIRGIKQYGLLPAGMTTSRVATEELRGALDGSGCVKIGTIAQVVKLKPEYAGTTVIYKPTQESVMEMGSLLRQGRILIVDEFSMVGDDVSSMLLKVASLPDCRGKLLVVGDEQQLMPVGQESRSLFCDITPQATLTEPCRYPTGSDLHEVAKSAREDPSTIDWSRWAESETILTYGRRKAQEFYDEMIYLHRECPDESTICLHYEGKDVIATNRRIREGLFGANPDLVMDGEPIRIVATNNPRDALHVADAQGRRANNPRLGGENLRVYSGKMAEVISLEKGHTLTVNSENTIPIVRGTIRLSDGRNIGPVNLLFAATGSRADTSSAEGAAFSRTLEKLRTSAMKEHIAFKDLHRRKPTSDEKKEIFSAYHTFKDSFIWVQHSYASTIHRIQGQTVDNAFVIPSQLGLSKDAGGTSDHANALAYVALTRASNELHVML